MNVITRLFNSLLKPPLWPYGFITLNFLFAVIAILSIYTLARDQHIATKAYQVQAKAFAEYRYDFKKADDAKMKILRSIALKIGVPSEELDTTYQPFAASEHDY